MSEKAEERTYLVLALGRLLAPLDDLAAAATPPTDKDYQVCVARFQSDLAKWRPTAHAFSCVGGVEFGRELDDMLRPLGSLGEAVTNSVRRKPTPSLSQEHLRSVLADVKRVVTRAIDSIPIEWESRLLAEGTPFSSHLHILDAVRTAKTRVHFFDRYLDPSVYDLYLRHLDRSVQVRLVSTMGNAGFGARAIEAAGRLAAKEFRDFQVVACQPSAMHDRNLRVDDTILFLGPSLKDVGRYPSNFAPSASTADAHQLLDGLMSGGQRVA